METYLDDNERRELRRKARSATLAALSALDGEGARDAIRKKAVELGEFSAHELSAVAEKSDGKPARLVDQQISRALADLKREGLVESPRRGIWALTAAGVRRDALQRMPYAEYLETPEWAQTRTAALERTGHRCALDVTHTDGLEVQHRTKERLGEELESDLVVLCAGCLALYEDDARRRRTGSIPPPVPQSVPAPVTPITAATDRKPRLLRRLLAS